MIVGDEKKLSDIESLRLLVSYRLSAHDHCRVRARWGFTALCSLSTTVGAATTIFRSRIEPDWRDVRFGS